MYSMPNYTKIINLLKFYIITNESCDNFLVRIVIVSVFFVCFKKVARRNKNILFLRPRVLKGKEVGLISN